jgi:hypothetical protein
MSSEDEICDKYNNNKKILILLITSFILLKNHQNIFLDGILIFSFFCNYNKLLAIMKYHNNIPIYILKLSAQYFLIIILIKNNNPFFEFLFFWLPFPKLFKGFFILFFASYLFYREYNNFNRAIREKIFQQCNLINKFFCQKYISHPKNIFSFIIIIIFVKLISFSYNEKLFIRTLNKDQVIRGQKFYIVANLFNNENILNDWTSEMMKLINYLGPENTYVSIFENGDSTDNTPHLLKQFEDDLNKIGVVNKIITDKYVVKGKYERIVFLSMLRNQAMHFLYEIPNLDLDKTKILFFNDIIFTYEDVIRLLNTNDQDYTLTCGLDFYESFYDTWVSWGVDGDTFRRYYPYFANRIGQNRLIDGEDIRVFSCWNGLAIFQGTPFKDRNLLFRWGTQIRASECIILIADMYSNGYGKTILNPNVKFAYEYEYYYKNKYIYPWSKNLITYFYYYFRYFYIPPEYNFGNLKDDFVEYRGFLEYYLGLLKK